MAKRGNGEGSIYLDAVNGVWVAQVELPRSKDGRRRRRKFTGKTRREVRDRLDAAISRQRVGMPEPDERLTVGEFLQRWIDDDVPGTVSDGTLDTYQRVLRLYLIPPLGDVRLLRLMPAHVTGLLRSMEERGLAAETRRMARAVLRRALRRAEQEGLIARNVAAIAEGPGVRRKEGRTLTPTEARSLLAAASGERLEVAITVALSLGLRRGEILGLRWRDFDLEGPAATVMVQNQLQRGRSGLVLTDVKTMRSRRRLHVPSQLVEDLKRHRARQSADRLLLGAEWRDQWGLVFTTPFGTPVDPRRGSEGSASAGRGPPWRRAAQCAGNA